MGTGASLNEMCGPESRTPLMIASLFNHPILVDYLLQRGDISVAINQLHLFIFHLLSCSFYILKTKSQVHKWIKRMPMAGRR